MYGPYEIWDNGNANIVAAYDSEEEALAEVRAMIEMYDEDAVRTWVLQYDDSNSPPRNIALGDALIERARRATPDRAVAD